MGRKGMRVAAKFADKKNRALRATMALHLFQLKKTHLLPKRGAE